MNEPLIEFNPKLPKLSANEKAVLELLVEAGRLIAPLYLEQEKQKVVGKEEIEKAAKKDKEILSPYTVIEKVDEQLVAVPYHKKYATLLAPIVQKLNEAANLTENKEFRKTLGIQAKALLTGSYDKAIITWLKAKPYILNISIGPVEHYDDQLFFAKASYQVWVGVLDLESTSELNRYKKIILSFQRKALVPTERLNDFKKVKAKVIHVTLFSGFMARTKFVGVNLPMDIRLVEKYGSEITLFNEANDLRLKEQIIPTFRKILPKSFRDGFSWEDLEGGNLGYIAIHELAHSYLYYRNAAKNLQDLFICIYELAATVLGLRLAGALLLQDVITSKQLESMVIAFICRSFYLMSKSKHDKSMVNRTLGSIIFINFLFESGALKQLKGIAIPNFMKTFVSLQELSSILEHLLSSGTRQDAEIFIKKYDRQLNNA